MTIKQMMVALAIAGAWCVQAAYTDDCITFSSAEPFALKTETGTKKWDGTLWTSADKTNWTEWGGALVSAVQAGGDYNLYVRGDTGNTKITGGSDCWVLTGRNVSCVGNIETLRGATGGQPSPTAMATRCYSRMFSDCTSLTNAPALPATTLADSCYNQMFSSCTSLTTPPALPATKLAEGCYAWMFSGCMSLADAPALPATELADWCYSSMFRGCAALEVNVAGPGKEWKIPVFSTAATDWGVDMFTGTGGTLQGQPALNATYYIASTRVPNNDCITFSSTAAFTLYAPKQWDGTLWTSTDKSNWTVWFGGTISAAPVDGTYHLHVRGNTNNTKIVNSGAGPRWTLTGAANIACTGNIETLRGARGDQPSPTKMAQMCYSYMFSDCTSLTDAPALPATNLAYSCYGSMFAGCTSLTTAPALPAPRLANRCYAWMFKGCTSLTNAPALSATVLMDSCYDRMFSGCKSLTAAPAILATSLSSGCCYGMFSGCTSLTTAPALPATRMSTNCYYDMFSGCTSLTAAPALPATMLADCCYCGMFEGCTSLTNAPALPATTLSDCCYSSMFRDCTSLKDAPALPATTLAFYCYSFMFCGCVALEVNVAAPGKDWKIAAASTTATDWGKDMFTGTGGTLQGQPELNMTYYIASAPKPGTEGNPWQIGAEAGDTVNAWTNGTGKLIVQGAGMMKSFAADGSDIPWPVEEIVAVEISGDVTGIGQNAWLGLGDGVTYNGLSAAAAKTMSNGFGGTSEYGRMAFKSFLLDSGVVQATVALETSPSLTNEWTEIKLQAKDVSVDANGRIVIVHKTGAQTQGFYLVQPMK